MYPQRLGMDPNDRYNNDVFDGGFVHCYIHENYTMKMHSHQFYEVNIITAGSGRHYIADTDLAAEAGDVFAIPPEIPHGYFTEGRLDVGHILLHRDFLERYREELAEVPGYHLFFDIEPQIRSSSGQNYNLRLSEPRLAAVVQEIRRMVRAEEKGVRMYENLLVLGLLTELSGMLRHKTRHAEDEDKQMEIAGVMEYIKKNLGSRLTVPELAARFTMSPSTLNRRFRSLLGCSPMQYLTDCRLREARELMRQKNYSKTEIAQMCGFYDLAHLNKYLGRRESED